MNTFISFEDMVNKGLKIGRHSAFTIVFGKKADIVNVWSGPSFMLGTVEVDGIAYDWFDEGNGFQIATA